MMRRLRVLAAREEATPPLPAATEKVG